MDRTLKKTDDKKTERTTRDRGDIRKTLHGKVLEDTAAKEVTPARDCGDSKPLPVKPNRIETPQRQLNPKPTKINTERQKSNEIGAKRDIKKATGDKEDAKRREQNPKADKKEVDKKKAEEVKAKMLPLHQEREVKKVTDDNADRGDARRREHNAKVVKKEGDKKMAEDSKAKNIPLLQRNDAKKVPGKIEDHETEQSKISKPDDRKFCEGTKVKVPTIITPIKDTKTSVIPEVQNRTYLDAEGRKFLREKYTVRLKNNQNANKMNDVKVDNVKIDDRVPKKPTDDDTEKGKANEPKDPFTEPTKPIKNPKEPAVQRRPIIKTIRLNNDSRMYKAVTFIDDRVSTPLNIKIPNHRKEHNNNSHLHKIKATESKASLINPLKRKKDKSRVSKTRAKSPLIVTNNRSPQTEVAKWAPACVNHLTKPYYEAWVNTTLAAITKCSKQDMLIEEQNIISTFKRALEERPATPDLFYENLNDERYTGRITVRR